MNVTLHSKRNFTEKLASDLEMGSLSGLSKWARFNHKSSKVENLSPVHPEILRRKVEEQI